MSRTKHYPLPALSAQDRAAFEKLRRNLISEYVPIGRSEKAIVDKLTHLLWFKKKLINNGAPI